MHHDYVGTLRHFDNGIQGNGREDVTGLVIAARAIGMAGWDVEP